MMASSTVGASEIARAVTAFLGFSTSDQEALLEVIEDYFTSPDDAEDDDDEEDDSEDNSCMPGSAHSLEGAVMQIKQ